MAFCTNCGEELAVGAKFCANCGAASCVPYNVRRNTVYDGELHKCPSCGEMLGSFSVNCPVCGFELRGKKTSHTVTSFAEKLENAKSEEQRISLIRNFPIPNTKEDIFEFMILASCNFDAKLEKATTDAWLVKIEQCYQKGKLLFKDDSYFTGIQNAYDQAYEKMKSNEKNKKKKSIITIALHTMGLWGGLIIFLIAFMIDISPAYADTSVYHVGAGAMMVFGAYVVGKKFNSLQCAGVGIVCGILSMILGSLLDSAFHENGSMMMVVGGTVIIMSVVNLLKYTKT